jgi:SSS family solute:Na+ symporter
MLVLPGVALIGILGEERALTDPDQAYLKVVELLLRPGVRGLVLCGLFASLMSSVDSIFNSISTLWSVDVYKRRLRPDADDAQVVAAGRRAILGTLAIGIAFAFAFTWVKLENPTFPLDPFFKKASYFIKNGFVVLIASAVFLRDPSRRLVWTGLTATIPLTIALNLLFAETPYLILTLFIILGAFLLVAVPTWIRGGWRLREPIWRVSDRRTGWLGLALGAGLAAAHVVFH